MAIEPCCHVGKLEAIDEETNTEGLSWSFGTLDVDSKWEGSIQRGKLRGAKTLRGSAAGWALEGHLGSAFSCPAHPILP